MIKTVRSLTTSDLAAAQVWQFVRHDSSDEPLVRAIKRIPVRNPSGKLFGTQVTLSNGNKKWALIGNVDNASPRMNEHFLTLDLENNGEWFSLARYHDHDYDQRGPIALARFFGLPPSEVFPILFDLRSICIGNPQALAGVVRIEPRERLTRAEVIALAVP